MDYDIRCSIPIPPENPPLLQIPIPEYRAARSRLLPFQDLPHESCKRTKSCPATLLVTSESKSLAQEINDQLLKGYFNGTGEGKINEIVAAYNFLNSNNKTFNVSIWYNFTINEGSDSSGESIDMMGVPRLVNMAIASNEFFSPFMLLVFNSALTYRHYFVLHVSNAYLEFLLGPDFKILFKFVKAMPKHPTSPPFIDYSTIGSTVLFTWVVQQLFPIILGFPVYEKQENIRIMTKMHGLGDGPYWLMSYIYFLTYSSAYMLYLVATGSFLGLDIFTAHDYSLQFVFYFVYVNLQIAFAFLLSRIFSKERNARVISYLMVIASGLVGYGFLERVVNDESFPSLSIVKQAASPLVEEGLLVRLKPQVNPISNLKPPLSSMLICQVLHIILSLSKVLFEKPLSSFFVQSSTDPLLLCLRSEYGRVERGHRQPDKGSFW
ncbi:hypothetical protein RHSIM_Rhsim07G0182600 [Rhododendron simsii]|uniref:Uncharacterized protein n=1 Tax=Rhododendron simsii TaxID=118357 RepID=A0A834GQC3_RHOSS|nr:hypothetical protein RHSIM_Rhsim07G0182600 [Rhododendron simsii]